LSKFTNFGTTVCKTDRPMLSDHCPSCLSLTLVYCGQTVGWIKMKLGMAVGLSLDNTVLHGDPAPPPLKGHSPLWPMSIVAKRLDELRCHLVWRYASDQKKGHSPTQFLADVSCSQTAGCYATSLQTYYQDQLCRPCFSLLRSCCLEFTNC